MSLEFRRRILTLTLLPLPLVLAVCALLVWQISRLHTSAQWVSHTQQVLSTVYRAERYLIDQETGLRGYLYTAEPVFLEPYKAGQSQFVQAQEDLRSLTADNPAQQKRIGALRDHYTAWLIQSTVAAQSPGICNPTCVAGALQRKREMDGMRELTSQIEAEEQRLLSERQATAKREESTMIAGTVIFLSIIGVVLVVFINRMIQRIEGIYSKALADREKSVRSEQKARAAAEALADEIKEQSLEMERLYRQVREERDTAQTRLAELGHGR
jgi:CHASE3 domain sensor protein